MLNFLSHFLPIQLAWCYLDPSFLLFLLIWVRVLWLTLWMFQSLSQTGSNFLVTRFLMKTLPSPNLVPPTNLMSFSGTDFPVSQRKSCYQNTLLVTLSSKSSKGRFDKWGTDHFLNWCIISQLYKLFELKTLLFLSFGKSNLTSISSGLWNIVKKPSHNLTTNLET